MRAPGPDILVQITEDRYRISGVIHALLTTEKIDAMTSAFEEIAASGAAHEGGHK